MSLQRMEAHATKAAVAAAGFPTTPLVSPRMPINILGRQMINAFRVTQAMDAGSPVARSGGEQSKIAEWHGQGPKFADKEAYTNEYCIESIGNSRTHLKSDKAESDIVTTKTRVIVLSILSTPLQML
jgi:hypothetical protein